MDVFGTYAAGFAEPSSCRYAQTIAPAGEPVTLAEAMAHCARLDEFFGQYVHDLIQKARRTIERRIGRQFLPATWTHSVDAFPDEICLEITPVTAVSQIVYVDYLGVTRTLPTDQYQVDISSPDRPARIRPVWGLVWPITRVGTYNAVVTTFKAGYADAAAVPAPAKQAILMLVAQWLKYREPVAGEIVNQVSIALDWALDAENPGVYV